MLGPVVVIETSGFQGQVGLMVEGAMVARLSLDSERRHARDLAAKVGQILQGHGYKPADTKGVIVARGPGSFTGLRVGLATAMALAYATGAKIVGVGSLHGIAEQANLPGGVATVAADALRGGSYVQTFMKGERGWAPSDELKVVPLISTPHPVVAMSARWPGCPANALVAEPALDGIGAIGLRRLAAHESDEPHILEPLYVQPSSAERQWANLGRS